MQIDITKLLTNSISTIKLNNQVTIPNDLMTNSLIDELKNITINGNLKFTEENELLLNGTLRGIMVLKDDLTLEPVEYEFNTEIEEYFDGNQKILDVTDVLWQNILLEIPSKVRSTLEDIEISGDGWRVISEEKFLKERSASNNPFSGLDELLNTKEEK